MEGMEVDTPTVVSVLPQDIPTLSPHIEDNKSNLFATIEDLLTMTVEWQGSSTDTMSQANTNPISVTRTTTGRLVDSDQPIALNQRQKINPTTEQKTGESLVSSSPNDIISSKSSSETLMLMSPTRRAAAVHDDEEDGDDDDITTERAMLSLPVPPSYRGVSDSGMLMTTPTRETSTDRMGLPFDRTITDTIPPFTSKSPVAKSPQTLHFESTSTNHEVAAVPLAILVTTLLMPAFAGERTIHVASMNGAKVSAAHIIVSCGVVVPSHVPTDTPSRYFYVTIFYSFSG